MKLMITVALTVIGLSSAAHAESFMCMGSGKFKEVGTQKIELVWGEPMSKFQVALIDNDDLQVRAYIDKSNSDGTHYLGIVVQEIKPGDISSRGALGSLKDMVMYMDEPYSQVACLPVD